MVASVRAVNPELDSQELDQACDWIRLHDPKRLVQEYREWLDVQEICTRFSSEVGYLMSLGNVEGAAQLMGSWCEELDRDDLKALFWAIGHEPEDGMGPDDPEWVLESCLKLAEKWRVDEPAEVAS